MLSTLKIKKFNYFYKHFCIIYKNNHFILFNSFSFHSKNLILIQNIFNLTLLKFTFSWFNSLNILNIFLFRFISLQAIHLFILKKYYSSYFLLVSCQINSINYHNYLIFFIYKYLANFFYSNIFNIVYFNFLIFFNFSNFFSLAHFFFLYVHWSFIKVFFTIKDYYSLNKQTYLNLITKDSHFLLLSSRSFIFESLSLKYSLIFSYINFLFLSIKFVMHLLLSFFSPIFFLKKMQFSIFF